MRTLKLCGAGLLACLAPTIWSNSAIAEPPQSIYYNTETPFIVCDTREEISDVLQAIKAHKLKEKLTEFGKELDANKEPVCLYSVIGPVTFGASEHVGLVFDQQGGIDMWVSKVHNSQAEFYLLWGELGKVTSI